MNCKQGDLAIVVRSSAGNTGKLVRCLRIATKQEKIQARCGNLLDEFCWITDVHMQLVRVFDGRPNGTARIALDSQLRPIRDNNGEDETLQWAPVPTKETA